MKTTFLALGLVVFTLLAIAFTLQNLREPGVLAVCFDASIPTDAPFVSSVIVTSPVEMNGAVTCPVGTLVDVRPQKQP